MAHVLVSLPDAAVKESSQRVEATIKNSDTVALSRFGTSPYGSRSVDSAAEP